MAQLTRLRSPAMRAFAACVLLLTALSDSGHSFVLGSQRNSGSPQASLRAATADSDPAPAVATSRTVVRVAVAGGTGRTGSLVVRELLDRNVQVVSLVRDLQKADRVFPDRPDDLTVQQCNLADEDAVAEAVKDCDAVVWCATGFSDAQTSVVERLKRLLGIAFAPKQSIDAVGVPAVGRAMAAKPNKSDCPRVVMLSSAGVTRPSWDEQKKQMFPGSADIPIVRLNPFGILDVKAESEQKLRQTGVEYAIVRPTGLSENWSTGLRPIFSQGDIAAGRIHRKDVAKILVDVLSMPEACGKTFEVFTLAGYPPAPSIGPALARLSKDSEGLPTTEALTATYSAMQQLLPGETQDTTQIALGQTYEQMDRGETGKFGKRGEEDVERATANSRLIK